MSLFVLVDLARPVVGILRLSCLQIEEREQNASPSLSEGLCERKAEQERQTIVSNVCSGVVVSAGERWLRRK